MEIEKALSIIRPLSDGVDPFTGEEFPPNSPYQQAEVVRALYVAVSSLEKDIQRVRKRASRLKMLEKSGHRKKTMNSLGHSIPRNRLERLAKSIKELTTPLRRGWLNWARSNLGGDSATLSMSSLSRLFQKDPSLICGFEFNIAVYLR